MILRALLITAAAGLMVACDSDDNSAASAGGGQAPVVDLSVSEITVGANGTSTFQITATDPDGGTPDVVVTATPAGLVTITSLGGNTWQVSGNGTPGTATITVVVSSGGQTVTRTVSVVVSPTAPELTVVPADQDIDEDFGTISLTAEATDPNGDSLTWSIATQNDKVNASISQTGAITLTSKDNVYGNDVVTITVSDGEDQTQATFGVTVHNTATFSMSVALATTMIDGLDVREHFWKGASKQNYYPSYIQNPIIKLKRDGVEQWATSQGYSINDDQYILSDDVVVTLRVGEQYEATIYAASGRDPEAPQCIAVDNTVGGAVYAVKRTLNVTDSMDAVSSTLYDHVFNLGSSLVETVVEGYGGYSWTTNILGDGERESTPFALCGAIEALNIFTHMLKPGFEPQGTLVVNWSPDNMPVTGDISKGEIGTTFYANGQIYVLGDKDTDTDEFDFSVLAHEYFHWLEDQAGRLDSVGGAAGTGDALDPRVAWSEGAATAFSASLSGWYGGYLYPSTGMYTDNSGYQMSDVLSINAEADAQAPGTPAIGGPNDGAWSMLAVTEIVYDLMDSTMYNVPGSYSDYDGDGFQGYERGTLPSKPMAVILSDRDDGAFMTVNSFIHAMKEAYPADADAIEAIAAANGVANATPWGHDGITYYSNLVVGGTTSLGFDSTALSTSDAFGQIAGNHQGNKLYNRALLRADFALGDTTCYELTATPIDGQDISVTAIGGSLMDAQGAGAAEVVYFTPVNGVAAFDVGSYLMPGQFTVNLVAASSASLCNI